MPYKFFNPYAEIRETFGKNLPHWQQEGVTYFLTYRLFDSMPAAVYRDWKFERENWIKWHPEPWNDEIQLEYHERFTQALERCLDEGHGCSCLRTPDCAKCAMQSMQHFDGDRLDLVSAVVMPNHVHALLVLNHSYTLEKLLESWKRFSATQINRALQRHGQLWQSDYFDRIVRDEKHFANCVRYIRRNPIRARLRPNEYLLFENEIARAIE